MTCQAIRLWRFNGLVAAFLDLGISYLLLCVSALVFFTSKFLELFGLCLPCPCDGLFGCPSSDHCFQKILVDCSSKKISSVLNSVEEKYPFDSMWEKGPKCCFNSMLVHERNVELEGEALHSSFSGSKSRCIADRGFLGIKEPDAVVGLTSSKEEGKFYIRGNGVASERWGTNLRRRREGVMSHGQLDMEESFQSPLSLGRYGDNDTEDSFFSVDSRDGREEASIYNNYLDKMFPDHELDNSHEEKICPGMDESSAEEAGNNCRGELSLNDNENDTIRLLEQALKEEHTARATLYLELEKERSAAASAADEAMAMILRLQKEKASIEMDARQYHRIIEEKTAYDAEEMSILKEILMRREREMHFLEMEVEAYRKNFLDDEVDADMLYLEATPHGTSSLPYSTEDRSLMDQHINRSMSDNQDAIYSKSSSQHEIPSIELRNLIFEFGEELPILQVDELADTVKTGGIMQGAEICPHELNSSKEINSDLQEKGMVYVDEKPCIPQGVVNELEAYLQTNESNVLGMDEKSITSVGDEHEKVNNACDYQNEWIRDLNSVTDADPHPPNIHGIDIEACMHPKVSVNASNDPVVNDTSSIPVKCDSPSFNYLENEPDITRSSSEASGRFPPMARSRGNHLRSELRRNSMSAVDYERSKIGNEVEWLRERLKVVQEGREKLKGNIEYKEEENNQVLREIQQLTEPEKAMRQAPLPPSSKVISKPRCWRSSSLSIHRSS